MDDVDGFGSSEGATQLRMDGFGTAGSQIGQIFRPGRGKTEAMGCGFTPKTNLTIQGQDIQWGEDIVSMGVTVDRGLNFEAHLSEMRRKSVAALPIIATISHLASMSVGL